MFGLFEPKAPQQQAASQPGTPGAPSNDLNTPPNINPQPTPGTAPNGVVPEPVAGAGVPLENQSPLDAFEKLWEPKTDAEGNPAVTDNDPLVAAIDPAQLQEVVSKANFASKIPAETLAAISEGGEAAQAAFAQAMNIVSQQSLAQATLVSNKLIEQAINKVSAAHEARTSSLLKNQNLTNSLNDKNPMFNHAAVKPVIESVKAQLTSKYPDATPAQLTEMAQNYVKGMAEVLVPKPDKPTDDRNSQVDDMDWDSFIS